MTSEQREPPRELATALAAVVAGRMDARTEADFEHDDDSCCGFAVSPPRGASVDSRRRQRVGISFIPRFSVIRSSITEVPCEAVQKKSVGGQTCFLNCIVRRRDSQR